MQRPATLHDLTPHHGSSGPCLVWELPCAMRSIASTIVGGGLGKANWVINLTVDDDYSRMDPASHLLEVADLLGLAGSGVGFMTAVDVSSWSAYGVDGAEAAATVGARRALWAADAVINEVTEWKPGTINIVATAPARLSDAAMVNAVATMTEAKVQALIETGIPGTGTASDALCLLCPIDGSIEDYGGPRSLWGQRLAQATYEAVIAGIRKQSSS